MSEPQTELSQRRWTVPMLAQARAEGRKLVMLTCYDASFARVLDDNGTDLILIGDSLGMVVQGHDSTLPVRVEDIVYHATAVARGARRALKIADFPFGSDGSPQEAHAAAVRFIQAGASMVKLEGAGHKLDTIRYLVDREIPVCGHLGLTPQSVHRFGGFKVQGREDAAAARLREDALAVADAGAALLVLEGVPAALAEAITRASPIPTIGIGAGAGCDGQVLVLHDLLGLDTIRYLVDREIPVCGHLGLTPQSVHRFGGFKVQGREDAAAARLREDALAVADAGAALLVLEGVPAALAEAITRASPIPTIGIGAGAGCDGQVLVLHDLLGLDTGHRKPKFVKDFLGEGGSVAAAIRVYADAVRSGAFPDAEHAYA